MPGLDYRMSPIAFRPSPSSFHPQYVPTSCACAGEMGGSAAGRSGGSLLGRHRGVVKLHRYTRSAPAKYQGLRVGCSFGILRRCQFSAVRCGEDICVPGISVSNPSMTPYCHSLRISVSRSEFEHRDWGLGDLGHGAAVLWVLSPW